MYVLYRKSNGQKVEIFAVKESQVFGFDGTTKVLVWSGSAFTWEPVSDFEPGPETWFQNIVVKV